MVTLKSIAEGIHPDWTLSQWFQWPPNIFALISIVLQRTGSYKICLIENAWWEDKDWHEHVNIDAGIWLKASNEGIELEKLDFKLDDAYKQLSKNYRIIEKGWDPAGGEVMVNLNDLRTLSDVYNDNTKEEDNVLKDYAIALVSILAIADACCAGIGLISQTVANNKDDKDATLFKAIANLLLTTTGSLSTLDKFHGTVLPKMRTPQSGIVLRSLSHHLTFHATEVEVVWRTFPWLNDDKQSLNLLVVPYPNRVYKTDFRIVEENYHSVRYFKGKIQEHIDIKFLDALVETIYSKVSTNNEVDVLVFPEMALSQKQYNYLLNKLKKSYSCFKSTKPDNTNGKTSCQQLPIIIAGVLHESEKIISPMQPVHNEVRMAVFFAGKWYDITQRKHHRWQLDRNQLLQYGLEGYFPTDRKWFELCSVLQRRLTILAPNGWLALTALICEDLARQEPVAEVIRGIGPTLLTALLSDGPQINTRWSARYASVLADDPGTAVLSITSRGMAKRSQRPEELLNKDEKVAPMVVGLWKDMIRGWKELKLEHDKHALMFTISAKYEKEYTLDGRSDGECSSVFRMDSINPTQVKLIFDEKDTKADELKGLEKSMQKEIEKMTRSEDFGDWHDIRLLSIISFSIDSIVDLLTLNEDDVKWRDPVDMILGLWEENGANKKKEEKSNNIFNEIKSIISESWDEPNKLGTAAIKNDPSIVRKEMRADINSIRSLIKAVHVKRKKETTRNFFEILVDVCEQRIKGKPVIKNNVAMAFLYNVNTKISSYKTPKQLNSETGEILSPKIAMEVTQRIKRILKENMESQKKPKAVELKKTVRPKPTAP